MDDETKDTKQAKPVSSESALVAALAKADEEHDTNCAKAKASAEKRSELFLKLKALRASE